MSTLEPRCPATHQEVARFANLLCPLCGKPPGYHWAPNVPRPTRFGSSMTNQYRRTKKEPTDAA